MSVGTSLRITYQESGAFRVQEHHHGDNLWANLKSISPRCFLREVAFEWELTKETIYLSLGCMCPHSQGWCPPPSTASSSGNASLRKLLSLRELTCKDGLVGVGHLQRRSHAIRGFMLS